MSIPQGSVTVNTQYFTAMTARVNAASSCAALQSIHVDVTISVNATLAAVTSQLAAVTSQATQLANDISALTGHIATLAASQIAVTNVGTVGGTATLVNDLASAILYIKAQGLSLVAFGTTNTATFVAQALALGKDLIKIESDYTILSNKISALTAQLTTIPAQLAALQSAITIAATHFPSCTL